MPNNYWLLWGQTTDANTFGTGSSTILVRLGKDLGIGNRSYLV